MMAAMTRRLAVAVHALRTLDEVAGVRISRMIVLLVDAEHAFHAADHTADRRADHSAERTGAAIAFMETVRHAARQALRLSGDGAERGEQNAGDHKLNFHETVLLLFRIRVTCRRIVATARP